MATIIFFGGLVTGFLIGWIGLALLTMASLKNRETDLAYVESASVTRPDHQP